MTPEQKARDMLERMGVEDAQSFRARNLVELTNLIERCAGRLIVGDFFMHERTGTRFVCLSVTRSSTVQAKVEAWKGP